MAVDLEKYSFRERRPRLRAKDLASWVRTEGQPRQTGPVTFDPNRKDELIDVFEVAARHFEQMDRDVVLGLFVDAKQILNEDEHISNAMRRAVTGLRGLTEAVLNDGKAPLDDIGAFYVGLLEVARGEQ